MTLVLLYFFLPSLVPLWLLCPLNWIVVFFLKVLCITCLLHLLHFMKESHYEEVRSSFVDSERHRDFLKKVLKVFKDLASRNIYPSEWMAMKMLSQRLVTSTYWLCKCCSYLRQCYKLEQRLSFLRNHIDPFHLTSSSEKSWVRHTGGQFHCAFSYITLCIEYAVRYAVKYAF